MTTGGARFDAKQLCRQGTSAAGRALARTIVYWARVGREVMRLVSSYESPGGILVSVSRNRPWPVSAKLRADSRVVEVGSRWDAWMFAKPKPSGMRLVRIHHDGGYGRTLEFEDPRSGRHVVLEAPPGAGDPGVLVSDPYSALAVQGRTVLDIGAGVGETAIQFLLKGAEQVVACEPFPASFRLAVANVDRNGLKDRVVLLQKAVGTSAGSGSAAGDESSGTLRFGGTKGPVRVPVTTLGELVAAYSLRDACLKVDCEGDEYAIFARTERQVLRAFDQIVVEYHYGARALVRRFRSAGFEVSASMPIHHFRDPNPYLYCGVLVARRGHD